MKVNSHYNVASKADTFGGVIFYIVVILSAGLLIFTGPEAETWLHPSLIVLAALAILCTGVTTFFQTEGNRILRETQLSDAFGAGIGEKPRNDYYNNDLPKTARRLAATTLENTFFTKEILAKMLTKERVKIGAYATILLILMICRTTPTTWLLVLSQTLFSGDLLLKWIRLERFYIRTNQVYSRLEQFFLQNGDTEKPNDMALLLSSFTDYECAKDEAVAPLDQKIFDRLNHCLSQQWNEIQQRLNIH